MSYWIFLIVVLANFAAWCVLDKFLYDHLERFHPNTFEEMGRPSLFPKNNLAVQYTTIRFFITRKHKALNDSYLSKLGDAMLALFILDVAILLASGLVLYRARGA